MRQQSDLVTILESTSISISDMFTSMRYDEVRSATVTTITSCECALVTRQYLEDVLGDNLANILFQNMLSFVMQNSKVRFANCPMFAK